MEQTQEKIRFFSVGEVAAEPSDSGPGRLTGYVVKYNVISHDRGGYREVFKPGAFMNLRDESPSVTALVNHEPEYLARTENGTLKLTQDAIGVRFSIDLPDTTIGRDTAALVKRGDLTGMSFGYAVGEFTWHQKDGQKIREHLAGNMFEVSVVYDPGIPQTELSIANFHAMNTPNAAVLADAERFFNEQKQAEETPKKKVWERRKQILEKMSP